jgi:lipopolysaccharide transport system ATP-binding protein
MTKSSIFQLPTTPSTVDQEVLVKVEGVSKKFCRSLKRSLWYGICDIASELNPLRGNELQAERGSELRVDGCKLEVPYLQQPTFNSGEAGRLQPATANPQLSPPLRPGEFWAVNDVSFELRRGECLGLIGHNGAGKTTLLKMLNGLIKPDRGRIEMNGRVGALIALGAGFNPILTGRENIYINGSVLGLSKKEIDEKIEEIIDFAEIGEFIDMPVQNYSSGMSVRLGFSIASSLSPEVLILDEVLAVGDIGFVIKCLNRVRKMTANAAVILVSHQMQNVSSFCSRVILMGHGKSLIDTREPGEAIDQYLQLSKPQENVSGTGDFAISDVCVVAMSHSHESSNDPLVNSNSDVTVEMTLTANTALPRNIHIYATIKDDSMTPLIGILTDQAVQHFTIDSKRTRVFIPLKQLGLPAGRYSVAIAVSDSKTKMTLARVEGVGYFRVSGTHTTWAKTLKHSTVTLQSIIR